MEISALALANTPAQKAASSSAFLLRPLCDASSSEAPAVHILTAAIMQRTGSCKGENAIIPMPAMKARQIVNEVFKVQAIFLKYYPNIL